jgi:hypothetical protein
MAHILNLEKEVLKNRPIIDFASEGIGIALYMKRI